MSAIASTAMTIAMLAAALLVVGGIKLARRPEERKRGLLMLVMRAGAKSELLVWFVMAVP